MQNAEIQTKAMNTFVQNGSLHVSKPEIQLFELLKTIYPNVSHSYVCGAFVLDILLQIGDINIDVEYDGQYWHQNKRRDVVRDKILQKHGYKTLRVCGKRGIPSQEQIVEAVNLLVNTNQRYVHIDL